jgi:hypothetical protein
MFRDVLRHIRGEPAMPLPFDAMGRVGRVDHVHGMDVGGVFLADAREDALRPRPLDPHRNPEFLLERLPQPLRKSEVHGGIEGALPFFFGGLDEGGCDRLGRRRRRMQRAGEHGETEGGRALEGIAAG